jgi:hypothetical protein
MRILDQLLTHTILVCENNEFATLSVRLIRWRVPISFAGYVSSEPTLSIPRWDVPSIVRKPVAIILALTRFELDDGLIDALSTFNLGQ